MNEFYLFILGALIGAFSSWKITDSYYQKGSLEQKKLFNKLSEEIRDRILHNPNKILTKDDLKEILNDLNSQPIDASRLYGGIDGGTF